MGTTGVKSARRTDERFSDCGAALLGADRAIGGALLGAVGAVIGTLGGRGFRSRLATSFGSDPPAAFIEDAVAIGGALLIILALR